MSTIKSERRSYSYNWKVKGIWDSNPVASSGSNGSVLNYVETGDSVKGWKQLIRAGLSATTGMDGVRTECLVHTPLQYSAVGIKSWDGYSASASGLAPWPEFPWFSNADMSLVADARMLAATAYHRQIQNARRAFGGATFLAEVMDVVRMFRNPAQAMFGKTLGFAKGVETLKRGWKRDAPGTSRKLASMWLNYQFGIAPLASDLTTYAIAVDKLSQQLGTRTSVRLDARSDELRKQVSLNTRAWPGVSWAVQDVSQTAFAQARFHGRYICSADLSPFAHFGFKLPELVEAVWEAIPWSFLVDYFTNVSDVLRSNLQANADVAWTEYGYKAGLETHGRSARRSITAADQAAGFVVNAAGGEYKAVKYNIHRSAVTVPKVDFSFSIPTARQGLNLVALVESIRSGAPPGSRLSTLGLLDP